VLFRPTSAAAHATPAHLRVLVTQREGLAHVSLPKRRGPPLAHPIALRLPGRPKKVAEKGVRVISREMILTPFSCVTA
jgi:hypothetical protein